MKNSKKLLTAMLAVAAVSTAFAATSCGDESLVEKKVDLSLSEQFEDGAQFEYDGREVTFPDAVAVDEDGNVVSYDVTYAVIDSEGNRKESTFASFDLDIGDYTFEYSYGKATLKRTFSVVDTTPPEIEFTDVSSGIFYEEGMPLQPLPNYNVHDLFWGGAASEDYSVLKFIGADGVEREWTYSAITREYAVEDYGRFIYTVTAIDDNGNSAEKSVSWKVKNYSWQAEEPEEGVLADFSSAGYENYIKEGDVGSAYSILNQMNETYLEEYEGANGVIAIDLGFNRSTQLNSVSVKLAKSFKLSDLDGKYLAVKAYARGGGVDVMRFAGNVYMPQSVTLDSYDRTMLYKVDGFETGVWKTYYIDRETAEFLVYTDEENGDINVLQFCFGRSNASSENMTLYIDSISIAEKAASVELELDGEKAVWNEVEGAVGYLVEENGESKVVTATEYAFTAAKGYVTVTALGDGVKMLDGESATIIYGVEVPTGYVATFDDILYERLLSDKITFKEDDFNYIPKYLDAYMNDGKMAVEVGQGAAGVVSAVKVRFPKAVEVKAAEKMVITLAVDNVSYKNLMFFDWNTRTLLASKALVEDDIGKTLTVEINLSAYNKADSLKGINIVFGGGGLSGPVKVNFGEIYLEDDGIKGVSGEGATVSFALNDNISVELPASGFTATVNGNEISAESIWVGGGAITVAVPEGEYGVGSVLKLNGGKQGAGKSVYNFDYTAVKTSSGWMTLSENISALSVGYTADTLFQFTGFYNFGAENDNTVLGFDGEILLDGIKAEGFALLGYSGGNMTITVNNIAHVGKVVTLKRGAVVYYNGKAVVIDCELNAIYTGTGWKLLPDGLKDLTVTGVSDGKIAIKLGGIENGVVVGFALVKDGEAIDATATALNGELVVSGDNLGGTLIVRGGWKIITDSAAYILYNDVAVYVNGTELSIIEGTIAPKAVAASEGTSLEVYADSTMGEGEITFVSADLTIGGYAIGCTAQYKDGKMTFTANGQPEDGMIFSLKAGAIIEIGGKTGVLVNNVTAIWLNGGWRNYENLTLTKRGGASNYYQFGADLDLERVDETEWIPLGTYFNTRFNSGRSVSVSYSDVGKCLHYSGFSGLEKTEAIIIEKGYILSEKNNNVYVIDKNYYVVWDGEKWTGSEEYPEYVPNPNITITSVGYTNNTAIQIGKALYGFTEGVITDTDIAATLNGAEYSFSSVQYWASGVLQFNTMGHNPTEGDIITVKAGSTIAMNGYEYVLAADFGLKMVGDKWTYTTDVYVGVKDVEFGVAMTYSTSELIQMKTTIDGTTANIKNFTADENGVELVQSGTFTPGWFEFSVDANSGNVYLTPHFNAVQEGAVYRIEKGSSICLDGKLNYVFDKTYRFMYTGGAWAMTAISGKVITLTPTGYTNETLVQIRSDLASDVPTANFLSGDHKLIITGNTTPAWYQMALIDGTIYINPIFNSGATTESVCIISAGSVFTFDGVDYTLTKTYKMTFNGTNWSVEVFNY